MKMAVAELIFILGLFCGAGCQTFRLVGSPLHMPNAGRIEISINETWHEICYENKYQSSNQTSDWNWNIENVIWACQQLGYPGAWLTGRGRFGNGLLGHSVDYFPCTKDEESVVGCTHGTTRQQSCEPGNAAFAICAIPGYLGCYRDQLPRALPLGSLELRDDMSVFKCIEYCRTRSSNSLYAAVQDGRQCFCGASYTAYDQHGKVPEQDCSQTVCPGDINQACGGIWKMAVYDITKGTCDELPEPANGTRFFGETYPDFGSEALFQCDPGFVMIGQNKTQCAVGNHPNGVIWSNNAPPVCLDERLITTTPQITSGTSKDDSKNTVDRGSNGGSMFSAAILICIGLLALALFILIVFAIIVCLCLIVRGRKKTWHKHATSTASATQQQGGNVNQGYLHDKPNNSHTTVAVISNGRQYPEQSSAFKRCSTKKKPCSGKDEEDNRASSADSGISGLGLVEEYHHGNGVDGDQEIISKEHQDHVKSAKSDNHDDEDGRQDGYPENVDDTGADVSLDGSVRSHNSKASAESLRSRGTYTATSDHGISDDETPQTQYGQDNGVNDIDEAEGHGQELDKKEYHEEVATDYGRRTDDRSTKEIVPDMSESGYTSSDYFALK